MPKLANPEPNQKESGAPRYIPPVEIIEKILEITDFSTIQSTITVSTRGLREIISWALGDVAVDEVWYKEIYVDVAAAILAGDIESCRNHYLRAGFFEGRLPFKLSVNERWYLNRFPDVAEACRNGSIASAKDHFEHGGHQEGRAGIPEHDADAEHWITLAREATKA